MASLGISAWLLSALRLLDSDPSNDPGALFLAHVGVFSSASVWMGLASVRLKRGGRTSGGTLDYAWVGLLLLSSLAIGGYGLKLGEVLMVIFAALGLVATIPQLRFLARPKVDDIQWLVLHLISMGNGAISAITAFFIVNVGRWGLSDYELWFWLGPGAVGGAWITLAAARLRRKGPPVVTAQH